MAIHHAARTLRTVFTERWSTLSYTVKTGTLFYMMQYLAAKGLTVPAFASLEVSLLIVRIAKLGNCMSLCMEVVLCLTYAVMLFARLV